MRAAVALAVVKLVRVLPVATERWQLPKVLQGVCNLLAERLPSTRDDARTVLVAIVQELGPKYMQVRLPPPPPALPRLCEDTRY